MTLRLAYNSNGFPQHELEEMAAILARLGYAGIAITPDVFHLDPFGDGPRRVGEVSARLADLGLAVAVETGARFLLDRGRKHRPTLIDGPEGAARRLDMLRRCLDLAVELRAETFSFWSGRAPSGLSDAAARERLAAGARAVLDHAQGSGVRVCLEPEPGMAVASMADLRAFLAVLDDARLALMLDVGHVPVTEDVGPDRVIATWRARLGGVQLDDCAGGRHEHLAPGEGEIDFAAVVAALDAAGYGGLAALELPRHAHDPVATAEGAIAYFRRLGALP